MKKDQVIDFNKKNAEIARSKKSYGLTYLAKKDFRKGEIVMRGIGKILDHQTSHMSVQIGPKKHYLPSSWTGRYWNHSCEPNVRIQTRTDGFPDLVASQNIKKGEEILYSYWMTEYCWIKTADELKVICKCKSKRCKGKIFSFSQLSKIEQQKFLKARLCSKYLLKV